MLRKRTKHTRFRDNTLNGVTRFERLRDNMSKREARFRNGNQHVDDYMGNKYARRDVTQVTSKKIRKSGVYLTCALSQGTCQIDT